ncbi:MAG: hypothetical protein U5R06_24000 [candidate division KSB1 bacterium]|nr:hypothetical protein [candidate division KSB1 bacterium]
MSKGFAQVADKVKSSVVTVKSTKMVELQQPELFRYFFDLPEKQPRQGLGSGVIVSPKGYIITNNHVIAEADDIVVGIDE